MHKTMSERPGIHQIFGREVQHVIKKWTNQI